MARIYVDHNARAPLHPAAREAMVRAMELDGNPSSQHLEGQQARAVVEDAREKVARLVGARAKDLVFTSGATEAIHLALHGALAATTRTRVLTFATEHHAVLDEVRALDGVILPVDGNGQPQLSLDDSAAVLMVMAANNETGVMTDIRRLCDAARAQGCFTIVDAAQVAGRMPFSVEKSGADAVAISACKFGGPPGVGALWLNPASHKSWRAVHRGGAQERGRRPGTENLVGIVGMGAAAAAVDLEGFAALRGLRDAFEELLRKAFPGVVIHGVSSERLPNTTFAAFPGVDVQLLLMLLDQAGVAASSGSACVSGAVKPSHVLVAMGADVGLARCSVRFSLGAGSSRDDVDQVLAALRSCVPAAAR